MDESNQAPVTDSAPSTGSAEASATGGQAATAQQEAAQQSTEQQAANGQTSGTGSILTASTDESQSGGQEGGQGSPAVPLDYNVTLPEGYSSDDTAMVNEQLKVMSLTAEQAKGFQDMADKLHARDLARFAEEKAGWENSLRNDPEIGGTNFNANVLCAQRGLGYLDETGQVRAILEQTGYGSHPAVVKMFIKAGQGLEDDTLVRSGRGQGKSAVPLAERIYPNMQ